MLVNDWRQILRIATAALILASTCACEQRSDVPRSLEGTFVTDHPRYIGRSMSLQAESVVFGVGGGEQVTYPLTAVSRDGASVWIVNYTGADGEDYSMRFRYDEARRTLVFDNQPDVRWRAQEDE